MARTIMLQGTSSHVGKSILATALCRIFRQDGYRVVPFKAQNMALNSYVTAQGGEMGRAQVAQAEAAGVAPDVRMNPILLKPTGHARSQVVVLGRPVGNMSAGAYHQGFGRQLWDVVCNSFRSLAENYDIVVIEGAGSPAEVNLQEQDIVNMRVAKLASAPVLLVTDIDRGGALAAIVGTLALLPPADRALVKGIIINKFRGDLALLQPALDFLMAKTGLPVLGVVPYLSHLGIDDEDSVSLEEKASSSVDDATSRPVVEIAVLKLPKIANFTDFDALARERDVFLRYVQDGEPIGRPDLVVLPGSKNTSEDLLYLRRQGYDRELKALVDQGVPLVGICGGFQMLGRELHDPEHTESSHDVTEGLGFFDAVTTFQADKVTHQVTAQAREHAFLQLGYSDTALKGYEIHMGRTVFHSPVQRAFHIVSRSGQMVDVWDGAVRQDGLVMGTYIHGIFDNDRYRRAVINALRQRKGLAPIGMSVSYAQDKEESYNRLASAVRSSLDMPLLYRLMQL